jgi:RimJ/RimL family protein N-acetyltransferase
MKMETERLLMRPWQPEEAEQLYEWAKDPDVGPMCGWAPHKSVEESAWTIANILNGPECYAVVLKETGVPVGTVELMLKGRFSEREDECELGYWLGKPYWAQRLMPEACEEILRHAFEDLGMNAVWCASFSDNPRSAGVQHRLGFKDMFTLENVEFPLINDFKTLHVRRLEKGERLQRKE